MAESPKCGFLGHSESTSGQEGDYSEIIDASEEVGG